VIFGAIKIRKLKNPERKNLAKQNTSKASDENITNMNYLQKHQYAIYYI